MTKFPAQIKLSHDAYETICTETARHLPIETGGILLGFRERNFIVVSHALMVSGQGASAVRYIRDDVKANSLLEAFLAERDSDDPVGYIGEWHSHPSPQGPSPTDIAAIRATTKTSQGPIALLIHAPGAADPFFGLIAERKTFGRTTTKNAAVSLPASKFPPLGPLPHGAVRSDGPVFISYRQSDGTPQAESLEYLLRAAGLVVWRDSTDLRAGTTTDRLEQILTQGLSAAVLVVTPEIVESEIVRERELPRLLELDENPAFSLSVANQVARAGNNSKCDFEAPDRLLRLAPARTLADKKQSNMLNPVGEIEIVRDLLMHRIEQRKSAIRGEERPVTIRLQTRPVPVAIDADESDLHIRIHPSNSGRLPSGVGLQLLQATLPLTSDAVFSVDARTVRLSGGAHLSVAFAVGAAFPETKIGCVEVLDVRGQLWSSDTGNDSMTNKLHTEPVNLSVKHPGVRPNRVAILVDLSPALDRSTFDRFIDESTDGFAAAAVISIAGEVRIDPQESGRLSEAVAHEIRVLASSRGRAEIHLAYHGPFGMAVLIGRHLNTFCTKVYEWDTNEKETMYVPALKLEPGVTSGPITEVLLP